MVKNLPANTGGHGFRPWSRKIPHAVGQLSSCTWACDLEPVTHTDEAWEPYSPHSATRGASTVRIPSTVGREKPPLATTRESLQWYQKQINNFLIKKVIVLIIYLYHLFIIIIIFYFTILYWFCHTSTWIHHGCTRVPPFWLFKHSLFSSLTSLRELTVKGHCTSIFSSCFSPWIHKPTKTWSH